MNTTKLVALLAAVLLTAGEFLVFDYDVHHSAAAYQTEVASTLVASG
jgi:hypothetical protein